MINLENRRILILIAMICHIEYVGHQKSGLVAAVALHLFMMWHTHRRLKKLRLELSPKASSDEEGELRDPVEHDVRDAVLVVEEQDTTTANLRLLACTDRLDLPATDSLEMCRQKKIVSEKKFFK
jgi:hypothetical protein